MESSLHVLPLDLSTLKWITAQIPAPSCIYPSMIYPSTSTTQCHKIRKRDQLSCQWSKANSNRYKRTKTRSMTITQPWAPIMVAFRRGVLEKFARFSCYFKNSKLLRTNGDKHSCVKSKPKRWSTRSRGFVSKPVAAVTTRTVSSSRSLWWVRYVYQKKMETSSILSDVFFTV